MIKSRSPFSRDLSRYLNSITNRDQLPVLKANRNRVRSGVSIKQRDPIFERAAAMFCKICMDLDVVKSSSVIETTVTHEKTGVQFPAFVCERCKSLGRITRATCKNFQSSIEAVKL